MTDRELLEKAAIAVDIGYEPDNQNVWPWNPLEDDGAALRLAVQLGMEVTIRDSHSWAEINGRSVLVKELHGRDPHAATRRAIVRAAAVMGARNE